MRKHLGMLILAVLVGLGLLLYTVAYTVDELEDIVLIKTFGEITAVREGTKDAGLNVKWFWPVQKLVVYDKRTSVFEGATEQVQTSDGQNMLVTLYCAWRIEDPVKFHRSIEHYDKATERLRDLLRDKKGIVIGQHNMSKLVNTDPKKMQIPQIEAEIHEKMRPASETYGIEVVSVGFKSMTLPETVTSGVIDSMKEDRQKEIRRLKKDGEATATAIVARAKSARQKILHFTDRKAEEIRTEGRLAAAEYYSKYGEDQDLALFLRGIQSLEIQLKDRSVILLDGSELPMVKWFRTGPTFDNLPKPPAAKPPAAKPAAATTSPVTTK